MSRQRSKTIHRKMKNRVYDLKAKEVLALLYAKAEKKGRHKEEVDEVIYWLTGYRDPSLIDEDMSYRAFFEDAPKINKAYKDVKGSVCGIKLADISDPLMRKIRVLDKLIDDLAKGKPLDKIIKKDA